MLPSLIPCPVWEDWFGKEQLPLISIRLCNSDNGYDDMGGKHRTQRPKKDVVDHIGSLF